MNFKMNPDLLTTDNRQLTHMKRIIILLIGLTLIYGYTSAQEIQGYQKPPQPILSLFESPVSPAVGSVQMVNGCLLEMEDLPSITKYPGPNFAWQGKGSILLTTSKAAAQHTKA